MIAVTGTRNNASLSVDFDATSCRTSIGRDTGSGDTGGGSGGNNTGPVPAPNNLAGSPGTNSINLTWSDNSNNEDSFTLQRSAPGGSWVTIATPGANTTSYNDSSLSPNSTYYYTMHAKNSTNTSAWSSTITVQTLDVWLNRSD
ncbi:fibronectin type III domain-containing protein [Colwellia sp. MSW7]|uniref:Fibronectin type III domain-containing protein n=1 Tax=Colwellia maritima TaxID=2912588 RepID=A0ABS9X0R2_9GAMM|nr:fibronectin type III domain-containing protein [Colwellia maritima]MCI2283808.1 fibronectin type III domain-containing protein [Colwellia maritima]